MTMFRDIRAARTTLPCFVLMGGFWAGFHAYAPQIKALAGASDWGFAVALLVCAIGSLLAMTAAPRIERRSAERALILAGGVLIGCFQLVPLIDSYGAMLAVLGLVGAGMGLMDVLMNAQVARLEAASGRSLMNLNHGVYSLAYGLAALAAAGLRGAGFGPDLYYLGAALCALMLLWPARRIDLTEAHAADPGPVPGTDPKAGRAAAPPGLPRLVLWGGLVVAIGFACENAVESWSALHVERSLGGSPAQGPLGPAALGLTMAVGRLSGQLLIARCSAAALLRHGALLAALGCAIAAMARTPILAYLGFAAAGLGISILAPMALALIGQSVPAAQRTRAIARGAVIGYCGFFFGPPLVGAMAEAAGLRAAFLLVAAALLCIPRAVQPLCADRDRRFFWPKIPRG